MRQDLYFENCYFEIKNLTYPNLITTSTMFRVSKNRELLPLASKKITFKVNCKVTVFKEKTKEFPDFDTLYVVN